MNKLQIWKKIEYLTEWIPYPVNPPNSFTPLLIAQVEDKIERIGGVLRY
jgi:hypothetical protein